MAHVESVNVGVSKPYVGKSGRSGIDKMPATGPVAVTAPGWGASGLAGDTIVDKPHHGGPDQAVYAYAREDLDDWSRMLDQPIRGGLFGENLTTVGLDVTGAVVGEVWRIGSVVLQVTSPRIPCATFTDQMQRRRWVKEFTAHGAPGAYLRVLEPGELRAGDAVTVTDRPESPVTIGVMFRALTGEPELLPLLVDAPLIPDDIRALAARRVPTG
ncbi:MAG TPA: MOSC domain-containing protein [Mycobacteriales bacterium]